MKCPALSGFFLFPAFYSLTDRIDSIDLSIERATGGSISRSLTMEDGNSSCTSAEENDGRDEKESFAF